MALAVVAVIFGLRALAYIISSCLIRRRREPETREEADREFEMRLASAALALHRHQRQWRIPAAEDADLHAPTAGEWQSKLVIAAGCDRASYIAHPRPFLTDNPG
ncbi:hypothetical protein KSP40_PGU019184 [Platanthera guangdongensis]|uniref:Uncharacterized protein n=1 Tax=Platanthera guangdongensis TaxID=2320717 RepID=A0ABR2M504_9ASPA